MIQNNKDKDNVKNEPGNGNVREYRFEDFEAAIEADPTNGTIYREVTLSEKDIIEIMKVQRAKYQRDMLNLWFYYFQNPNDAKVQEELIMRQKRIMNIDNILRLVRFDDNNDKKDRSKPEYDYT